MKLKSEVLLRFCFLGIPIWVFSKSRCDTTRQPKSTEGLTIWFPNQVCFWEAVVPHYYGAYNPYHPCMVYLPTFGWFLW